MKSSSFTHGVFKNSLVAPFLNDEEVERFFFAVDTANCILINTQYQAIVQKPSAEDGFVYYELASEAGNKTVLVPTSAAHEVLRVVDDFWVAIPMSDWTWNRLSVSPRKSVVEKKKPDWRKAAEEVLPPNPRIGLLHALSRIPGKRKSCKRCGMPDKEQFLEAETDLCRLCVALRSQRQPSDEDRVLAWASQVEMHPSTAKKMWRNGNLDFTKMPKKEETK